jgi:hypothetical protein
VRVLGKNTTAVSSRASDGGLSENRTSGQDGGRCNGRRRNHDEPAEEVEMEDKDYAKLRNRVVKPKKGVAGKAGPELSSEKELMVQFSTVSRRKKPKKSATDDVKQSSDTDQNINKSRNHNQAKERTEQG